MAKVDKRLEDYKTLYERAGKEMAKEKQIGGNHYKDGFVIEPIEFIHKNNLGFIQGNCIKYICRFRNKNGREDLEKIKHYVDLLIEMEYPNE